MIDLRNKLNEYWYDCIEILPYEANIGAATYHPECFFGVFKEHCSIKYIQRCTREADGRSGESPNRLLTHTQYQVLIKNTSADIKERYLDSLKHIGLTGNDIKFIDNNWSSKSLGAAGVGWEVLYYGTEITQYTYFHKMGDIILDAPVIELAYGLERCELMRSLKTSIYSTTWSNNVTYGDLYLEHEKQFTKYYQEYCVSSSFENVYHVCLKLIEKQLYLPAYQQFILLNNIFNQMSARKEISATSHNELLHKMTKIANLCAKTFIASLKK